jgi:predicted enzyme related to lactoylglutathione lyase
MPRRESYTQGTPNWVDLRTRDVEAAKAFYGSLFGWTYEDEPGPDGQRIAIARKDTETASGIVAAIGPAPSDDESFPLAVWNTYLAVDNVHTAVARTITGGGTVVQAPIEVDDAGVLAVVTDAGGAPLGLWQARNRIGATLVNEPGAVIWNELTVDDLESALVFYDHVFGLTGEIADPGSGPYITFRANGDPVAGACPRGGAGAPSHWHVYFGVDDAARAAARTVELGGDVLAGPMATAIGPMAAVRDSLGAMFSVFEVPSLESV